MAGAKCIVFIQNGGMLGEHSILGRNRYRDELEQCCYREGASFEASQERRDVKRK